MYSNITKIVAQNLNLLPEILLRQNNAWLNKFSDRGEEIVSKGLVYSNGDLYLSGDAVDGRPVCRSQCRCV